MTRRLARASLLCLVLAASAFALAGCGSSSDAVVPHSPPLDKEAYIAALQEAGSSSIQSAQALESDTTAAAFAAGLTQLQADLRIAAAKLQGVVPPNKVSSLHTQLIASLLETANQIDPAIAAAQAGNRTKAARLYTQSRGLEAQKEVQAAMAAKGYV
jgi:hypothetical protein